MELGAVAQVGKPVQDDTVSSTSEVLFDQAAINKGSASTSSGGATASSSTKWGQLEAKP